jgi:hypothetical protein
VTAALVVAAWLAGWVVLNIVLGIWADDEPQDGEPSTSS